MTNNNLVELRSFFAGKKYYVRTYGCQLNENDSEKISGILDEQGMTNTDNINAASVIVFNTCTIRENANDKIFGNLGIVKGIKRKSPDVIVILCGCMMKEEHNVTKVKSKYKFVDLIFGPSDIYKLPALLFNRMNEGGLICGIGDEDLIIEDLPVTHKKKFRALSTIIYGCNNFCSYCIVPYVRGRERSRAPEDVLKELKMLGDQGFKEVMLLGQNVNSYGKDFDSYDFADLLSDASKIDAISRIRFMTSHPKDTDRKLLDVMANGGNIMPHLHLPMQSGSDRVLALMNRKYSAGQYLDIVEYARKVIPDISITTDIIVGFPGEKEEDFSETLSLMERIRFDNAFTFMFSPRKGTPAADMDDQIPDDVMRERFSRLVKLQNKCTLESGMKTLNTVQTVLVEGLSQNSDKVYAGRTPHNRLVNFTCDKAIEEGDIVNVDITSVKTFSLNGRFLSFNSGNGG